MFYERFWKRAEVEAKAEDNDVRGWYPNGISLPPCLGCTVRAKRNEVFLLPLRERKLCERERELILFTVEYARIPDSPVPFRKVIYLRD